MQSTTPTFGSPLPGIVYTIRHAAYAVIRNHQGEVATVRVPAGYWLPGGGSLEGETPEETVAREIREELGDELRMIERMGQAIQYFFAAADNEHYEMHAVFFRGELAGLSSAPKEYEICWVDITPDTPFFFHACHDWAVRRESMKDEG